MSDRKLKCRGFTLVELLVVIGIIGLLISILLPTLGAARKQANATRCATQLKEIGNALQLYATDFKGALPMVRHETNANTTWPPAEPRGNPSFTIGTKKMNEYWYGYLLKYFTKGDLVRNVAGDVSLKNYQRTPLWGCPEAEKTEVDILSTSAADYNSGYGMGPYHLYRPDRYKGVNGTPTGFPTAWHWPMIEDGDSGGKKGRYIKITEVDKPSEKGIVADSRSWFLEIRNPTGQGDPPLQWKGYLIYETNQIDQFDRYRHGKYPNLQGTFYSPRGGKQAFNILFVDGHVESVSDVRKGYRAFRGNYPG